MITLSSASCYSQKVKVDDNGNYYAAKSLRADSNYTKTGKVYTDGKGTQWPVYLSSKGKPFIFKVSANTGNRYRMYLKLEGQS